MSNDKIKRTKKKPKLNRINIWNQQLWSWDQYDRKEDTKNIENIS